MREGIDVTTCIKCGRPIEDGELFCTMCDLNPDGQVTEQSYHTRPSGKMQTPVKQTPKTVPVSRPAPEQEKKPQKRTSAAPIVILAIVALLSLALSGWMLMNRQNQRVSMRLRESELEDRERYMDTLERENTQLKEELDEADRTISSQDSRIEQLERNVNTAESSVSQTQYDLSAQQAQLQRVQEEKEQLQAQYDALEKEKNELQTENEKLQKESTKFSVKATFMDDHIVFVENDGTNLFHRYDCPRFAQKSFWAYSKKLAESRGYDPCPYCCS